MAFELKLSILSPERRLLQGERVEEVTLPGSEGQIQILEGHAPMIGTLETGVLVYKTQDGARHTGVVSSGFFEVSHDKVSLLCEHITLRGEINVDEAKKAQHEAEQMLKEADLDEHAFKKYQLQLERALIQQQLAGREHETTH